MNEFISSVTSQLGISEDDAKKATGGILGLIKDNADSGDFSKLMDSLQGASEMTASAGSGTGRGGGLLGKVTSALGGNVGNAAGVLGILSGSGLSADKAGSFVSLFINFAKEKAGPELIEGILDKIPELKALIK